MRAFSRIIATIGVLLVALGVAGPLLGFDGFNVFPGIFLLFIGRVFAKQAKQRETNTGESEPEPQRALNTERRTTVPPPPRREPPRPEAPPLEFHDAVVDREEDSETRESIFESILIAGGGLAEEREAEAEADDRLVGDSDMPMSSAEMIARAHRRWDRRP